MWLELRNPTPSPSESHTSNAMGIDISKDI